MGADAREQAAVSLLSGLGAGVLASHFYSGFRSMVLMTWDDGNVEGRCGGGLGISVGGVMKGETKNEHGLKKFGHPPALRRRCFAFMLAKNILGCRESMRSNERYSKVRQGQKQRSVTHPHPRVLRQPQPYVAMYPESWRNP